MRWRIERRDGQWVTVDPDGGVITASADRGEALRSMLAGFAAAPATVESTTTRPFASLMAVEGRWTGDGRLIMVDGLSWDGLLPIPLTLDHGEGCLSIVGRGDEISRVPGASADERFIVGTGVLDLGGSAAPGELTPGQEAERQIDEGFLRGVSIDIDNFEAGGVDPATVDDPEDAIWLQVAESARIRGLALCPIPAFAEAYITLGAVETDTPVPAIDGPTPLPADEVPEPEIPDDIIIVASGHTITLPSCPPAEWFTEPTDVELAGALTVTDEGRVYGLLAPSHIAHIGRPDRLTAPRGNVDYSRFLRGETIVAGGGRVVTGNLTLDCGHADVRLASAPTISHYDNTCSIVATAAVGECAAGTWVAGALLPGVPADSVRRMMACQLSGDWRPATRGGYDLLGALLVPVPGYPMARRAPSVTMRDGALVASAVPVEFADGPAPCDCAEGDLSSRVAALEALVFVEGPLMTSDDDAAPSAMAGVIDRYRRRPERVAALAAKIRGA